jgi:hypothetical protein
MITTLALMACLELGNGLTPRVAADEAFDLPDALGEACGSSAAAWRRGSAPVPI